MDNLIYQLFILIYFDMFKMYHCTLFFLFWCKQQTVVDVFFLVCCFFLSMKNQLLSFLLFLFFLYNISGSLEWCVCMYGYSSLLRSFPLWPCCVGGFFFLIYIYIFFSSYSLCTLIDSVDRSIDRSFIHSFGFFFFFSV
jgi:hypothetical protein